MTERVPRAARWSRRRVRALAWTTGIATFLAGIGILGRPPSRTVRRRVGGSLDPPSARGAAPDHTASGDRGALDLPLP